MPGVKAVFCKNTDPTELVAKNYRDFQAEEEEDRGLASQTRSGVPSNSGSPGSSATVAALSGGHRQTEAPDFFFSVLVFVRRGDRRRRDLGNLARSEEVPVHSVVVNQGGRVHEQMPDGVRERHSAVGLEEHHAYEVK